eukprot:maker-scaffold_24-snap-gene-5.47-mRNA-1 protein AED:0.34 eAED:1.00 QI:0/0/0/1/1/1/2/0/227
MFWSKSIRKSIYRQPINKLSKFHTGSYKIQSSPNTQTTMYNQVSPNIHIYNPCPTNQSVDYLLKMSPLKYRIANFFESYALPISVGITAAKATLADVTAQKIFEKKEHLDKRRTLIFFIFGGSYSGIICHIIYTKIYPFFFPELKLINTIGMILCDNLINTPLIFYPIFYNIKALVEGIQDKKKFLKQKFSGEWQKSVMDAWKIWVPTQFITFVYKKIEIRIRINDF